MIKFYYHPSPNPLKIALYLEETGEPYELIAVDTRKGEQHADSFKAINPNAKTPAMMDGDVRVFDSNAMLLYLADKIYMMGNEYTIVDMSVWGWARVAPFVLGADAWEKLPHVKRLLDEINARPAAQRAEALKTKFTFKTEVDEDARKMLFPSNERLKNTKA